MTDPGTLQPGFQSTPPYGGDNIPRYVQTDNFRFQSTPPYGGDRILSDFHPIKLYFNPRPHTGTTVPRALQVLPGGISIHAPIRGRRIRGVHNGQETDFNPRPHTGATASAAETSAGAAFQSTPPYGGDCQTKQFDILRSTLLVSRKSFPTFPKPHPRVLFLSVCFPLALAEPSGQTEFYLTSMQTRNPLLFYHF